ncbi:MAG: class II aldolase [Verrucomicrobia bacterium]|nr:class II aldolase [Verrucomicrobiota bacterium]
MNEPLAALLELSHDLGREDRQLAILAEGNTSAKLSATEFAVKASGACLATLTASELTVCHREKVLALLDRKTVPDEAVQQGLLDARVDPTAKKPSLETMFHAWLLTLEGVNFVAHCHPLVVNQILCSPRARDFSEQRMFPDEIVCCGPTSVYVPYADPGLPLAWQIRERTKDYVKANGQVPRLIVLQNHGLIALGGSPGAVMACVLMATKAAAIFVGAAAMGGPNFLLPQHVDRITSRPDEAHRQRELRL